METLIESGIDFSIFFYNPNIHPVKEYEMSKKEELRLRVLTSRHQPLAHR